MLSCIRLCTTKVGEHDRHVRGKRRARHQNRAQSLRSSSSRRRLGLRPPPSQSAWTRVTLRAQCWRFSARPPRSSPMVLATTSTPVGISVLVGNSCPVIFFFRNAILSVYSSFRISTFPLAIEAALFQSRSKKMRLKPLGFARATPREM